MFLSIRNFLCLYYHDRDDNMIFVWVLIPFEMLKNVDVWSYLLILMREALSHLE